MPGHYPMMHNRQPVAMAQVYPPARSYSLAKLNQPRDCGLYEKVKVDKMRCGDRRPHRPFEQLRRQQSYDGDLMYPRMMYHSQPRRPEGFDSLKLLGAHNDDRYLDRFMDSSRGRPASREVETSKNKHTLLSAKSSTSKISSTASSNNKNKENKRGNLNISSEVLAFLGSLANSSSVDNIYESVEQIHYRKSLENMKRREKIRSVHKTGHPLFDHLREERAMASIIDDDDDNRNTNTLNKRGSRSAGPSRKTSVVNSPTHSSPSSSGDEQDNSLSRNRCPSRTTMTLPHQHQHRLGVPSSRRTGSAGSESEDEWVIPRPKIGVRRREVRTLSTDDSDSSNKSSPIR